ncbi:MAG TPA: discoidin domain-containing protein [Polyangiaceae bacterium]|nr:discoidin domain-containing protein [Polyangiaceae bacterium]
MSSEEAAPAPLPAPEGSAPVASAPAAQGPAPVAPRRPRPVWEWFWRGHALGEARREIDGQRSRYGVFEARARAAAEFGRRALDPGEARAAGTADALASELYVQAAYWALLALAGTDANTPASKLPFDLTAAMALVDREVLLRAAGSALALDAIENAAALSDYFEAELTDQAHVALTLRNFTESLLTLLSRNEQRVWLLRVQRLTRVGALFVVGVGLLVTALLVADWAEQRRDLARDKAWHASSVGASSCNSPAQFCDESPDFFFHTAEERNPWLEIDLGAPTQFSAVRLINRRDCCRDRASPIVIEASDDQKAWREIARHEGTFSKVKLSFPSVRARYLRVRIPPPKLTNLHLAGVRVLP